MCSKCRISCQGTKELTLPASDVSKSSTTTSSKCGYTVRNQRLTTAEPIISRVCSPLA